jgi:hypothetical protein
VAQSTYTTSRTDHTNPAFPQSSSNRSFLRTRRGMWPLGRQQRGLRPGRRGRPGCARCCGRSRLATDTARPAVLGAPGCRLARRRFGRGGESAPAHCSQSMSRRDRSERESPPAHCSQSPRRFPPFHGLTRPHRLLRGCGPSFECSDSRRAIAPKNTVLRRPPRSRGCTRHTPTSER